MQLALISSHPRYRHLTRWHRGGRGFESHRLTHLRLFSELRRTICVVVCAITTPRTPARQSIQDLALRLHADVGIVGKPLRGDVSCNFPDDAILGLRLSKLPYRMMPEVVKAEAVQWRTRAA